MYDPVSFGDEGGFKLGRSPLEGAGGALGAEGLTELLSLGAEVGDGLVNGAAIRTQKNTPPKESYALRGVLRVGDYARPGFVKSRPAVSCPRSSDQRLCDSHGVCRPSCGDSSLF